MRLPICLLCYAFLIACDSPEPTSNPEQMAFYQQWANKNVTDAQIDAWQRAEPREVREWRATVTNVREVDGFTIIDTAFRNQTYELWVFESDARDRARRFYAKTELSFSGDLLAEKSMTHKGARENPEFGVYPSYVAGGGVELTQTAEGIRKQHQLDRQAAARDRAETEARRRDSQNEERTSAFCKDLVTRKLMFPVSADFSWFEGRTQRESDTRWVYTDVVTSLDSSGKKRTARFICTVAINGANIEGKVQFLK